MFYQTRNKIILILVLFLFMNKVCFAMGDAVVQRVAETVVTDTIAKAITAVKEDKQQGRKDPEDPEGSISNIIAPSFLKKFSNFVNSRVCGKFNNGSTKKRLCVGTISSIAPVTFLTYTGFKFLNKNVNVVKDGTVDTLNITKHHKEEISKQKYQHVNDTMQAYKDVVKIDSEICSQTINKTTTENNTWCDKTRENINSFLNTMQNTLHNNGE